MALWVIQKYLWQMYIFFKVEHITAVEGLKISFCNHHPRATDIGKVLNL